MKSYDIDVELVNNYANQVQSQLIKTVDIISTVTTQSVLDDWSNEDISLQVRYYSFSAFVCVA